MRVGRLVALVLIAACCAFAGLNAASAEPLTLPEDKLALEMPAGWTIVKLVGDERVSLYEINGGGAPFNLYVFRTGGPDGSATSKKEIDRQLRDFLTAEKTLDFVPRGSARTTIAGQPAKTYTYKDEDLLTRLATWQDGEKTRRYIWRVEIRGEKEAQGEVLKRFDGFVMQNVDILTAPPATAPDGLVAPKAPAAPGAPEKPAAPASPEAPKPSPAPAKAP